MNRSELIERLARHSTLSHSTIEQSVKTMLNQMSETLANGERIEVRGFGSFSIHVRPLRRGRNPKTGESVTVPEKRRPHFKPGLELRQRVDASANSSI